MTKITIANFRLPENLVNEFRARMGRRDADQWGDGDFLIDVVEEYAVYFTASANPERADKIRRRLRARIIDQLATETGVDKSTLRDREVMARFYPEDMREKYAALTYHQLRACKRAGAEWQKWADWALEHLPAPVDLIRLNIDHNGDLPPKWLRNWERLFEIADTILEDRDTPYHIHAAVEAGVATMREAAVNILQEQEL